LRRLCLDSHNCEVGCIHPDPATIEKFLIDLRFDLQYEELPSLFVGVPNQPKSVILRCQSRFVSVLGCFLLALEQSLQHVIEEHMGAGLGGNVKRF